MYDIYHSFFVRVVVVWTDLVTGEGKHCAVNIGKCVKWNTDRKKFDAVFVRLLEQIERFPLALLPPGDNNSTRTVPSVCPWLYRLANLHSRPTQSPSWELRVQFSCGPMTGLVRIMRKISAHSDVSCLRTQEIVPQATIMPL